MKKKPCSPLRLLALACTLAAPLAHAAPAYTVSQRWSFGEAGRWDYADVDPLRHRLYLSRGDHVQVLELPSGKVAGEIGKTNGVHGVAFAQEFKLGFTSNGRANSITVFDLDTLQVKQEVKIPAENPDAILYEAKAHKLYTFNGKSADVTVLAVPSMKVLATIKVGGKPEFAASDEAGRIYFNVEDTAELLVLDVATNKLAQRWPLKGCDEPSGLALDAAHARVFSVCHNKIMTVTDMKTGKRIADVAIGRNPDAAIYDPASGTVFSSNGEGSLTIIHQADADHYSASTLATEKGARTMAFDAASKQLFLPVAVNKVFTVLVVSP